MALNTLPRSITLDFALVSAYVERVGIDNISLDETRELKVILDLWKPLSEGSTPSSLRDCYRRLKATTTLRRQLTAYMVKYMLPATIG